jgi:hypothetical protein
MNVLKALFNTSLSEAPLWSAPSTDLPGWPAVEPLWQPVSEASAIVTETIAPQTLGRVKFQGTRWRAYSDRPWPLEAGTAVRVIGRHRSNILIVQPLSVPIPS